MKSEAERGYLLHPGAFDQSEERGVKWARNGAAMRQVQELHSKPPPTRRDCLRAIETTGLGNDESLPRLLDAAHCVGTDELHSALADAEPVADRACVQPRFLSLILRWRPNDGSGSKTAPPYS